ncbi:type II toxin-antitoxin system RelE family toxin [Pimelobacter simplex]|uniref:type II toxin-antitoxin system RelE family toxin n=1 Tax=Nocardioides simplex TaxID=2045 RepID=UPI0021501361|nr:type II toxin-antitoxin system RelE/ParE family toxin [Pimelobacter simplex]UUW88953.1 type II toxin-antitoxin system RelE/ParE family toxin [Pimelobacter simplex]UUW98458.1 type II toxin-antitoxin system RelE/ParE family toxin [Pimelobacter simplex]
MAGSEPQRYRIELTTAAARQLRRLDRPTALRIRGAIELLARDPHPPASRRLVGRPAYRVRVGDYRILYTVEDDVLVVAVFRVGHRRDVDER